jgi:hypothetical protein
VNHDEVWNPTVDQTTTSRMPGSFEPSPMTGHTALLFVADPGDPQSPRLRRMPGLRERVRRSYQRYVIDTAPHSAALSFTVPTQEEAFFFKVWAILTWQVQDVDAYVRSGLGNVKPIIWGAVDQPLRVISRRHPMEHAGDAEEEMTVYLERKLGDIDYGLRVSLISLNVRLDESAARYLAARVETRQARMLAEDENELRVLRGQHAASDARQRGELESAQLAHAAEIERLRNQQELELKQQRLEFYRSALRGDNVDMVIMHLVEHPQDVQAVIKMLHEGRTGLVDHARSLIKDLIVKDLMNAADAEPLRASAFELLARSFKVEIAPTATATGRTRPA